MQIFGKYTRPAMHDTAVYECIAELSTGEFILIHRLINRRITSLVVRPTEVNDFKEYVEPKVHTRYVYWIRNKHTGEVWTACQKEKMEIGTGWLNEENSTVLKVVEITYVE